MNGVTVDIREKSFDAPVLRDIRFALGQGEVAALLGPSGSGKTTLLSLIAGIEEGYSGEIQRPEGAIAMVFQAPRLLPWRSLLENITLIPGCEDAAQARELLTTVGLAQAMDQFPEKVSLGMQRRAALARALAIHPTLVLMDEPTVSLDAENAALMRGLIRDLMRESGATALIATHDRREALALADRVLELEGSPASLVRDRPSPLGAADRLNPKAVDQLFKTWFAAPARAAE